MVSIMDSYFESDHTFKDTDGLMLAFGITAYDDNQESIEDPRYGRLKAYYKTWGLDDSESGVTFTEIPSSYCTRAELGLPEVEGDEESDYSKPALFFETHKNSITDVSYYTKKFKCLKTDDLHIHGDYNSVRTRSLVFMFEKCSGTVEGSQDKC